MRNIFLLFTCLCCLQACKDDDKDVNWMPDALTVSSSETLVAAGSGNWKVILPTEYKGSVKLDIQTDKAWEVEVTYMTTEEDKWITPSVNAGEGSSSLSLAIADNSSAKDRKASVVITTRGDIPVKKTITIIQGNVDDVLTLGTIDEDQLPQDLIVSKNADGSLALTLSKGFTGDLNVVTYSGSAVSPVAEISYPNEEQKDWIALTETNVIQTVQSDARTLSLTIGANADNVYREAVVTLIATAGELTVTRKIEIAQYGVEDISWNEDYCQLGREIIVSSDANDQILVATCENINPADIEVSGSTAWLTLSQEEGRVYAKVLVNESVNTERTAELSVKNKKTGASLGTKMPFRQCMYGYGVVLSKLSWGIAAYSDNVKKQFEDGSINKLINNEWSNKNNTNRHVQFDGGNDSNPYVITFDLGENPRTYNYMGIMPRLQWTAPAPTTVKIEVSDNLDNGWETVVEKEKDNGFKKEEIWYKNPEGTNSNWYDAHYEGIVHWFKLSDVNTQKRYIRLSVYETLWGGNPNYVLCMDEVFVSER